MALAVATLFAADAQARSQGNGAIRGSVHDADVELPAPEVRVSVVGTLLGAVTSEDGDFLVENVPPGSYTLTFAKPGYERAVVSNVVVTPGKLADLRVDIQPEIIELEELIVTGADLLGNTEVGLLDIRAAAVALQDAVSSEVLSKAGVSDVADALKLVVGASVVEGKYATVRGLSDRYTGTTLNGVRVPSADPRRKAVQVDLFPTGTIDSVTVTKTFTPDLQGDFTGGGIDIKNKSIPDRRTFVVSYSAGRSSEATDNPAFLTYPGARVEFWGRSGADRDLPQITAVELPPFPAFSKAPTPEQMLASLSYDAYTTAFAPAMGVTAQAPGRDSSFSLLVGDRWEPGGVPLGAIAALSWTHRYDFYEHATNNSAQVNGTDDSGAINLFDVLKPRQDTQGTEEILWSALAGFNVAPTPNHELSLQAMWNQAAEDTARFQLIQFPEETSVTQNQALRYVERHVGSFQLHGNHTFPGLLDGPFSDLKLHWTGALNVTGQEEPDVRFFRNIYDSAFGDYGSFSKPSNSTEPQNTRRIFRDLDEDNRELILDAVLPFTQWGGVQGEIKSGFYFERTDRDYTQRSFSYYPPKSFGGLFDPTRRCALAIAAPIAQEEGELWTDHFLDPERIGLATVIPIPPCDPALEGLEWSAKNQLLWTLSPLGTDVDYQGAQDIDAFYAMVDLPLHRKLRLIGGARLETTDIAIVPSNERLGLIQLLVVLDNGSRGIATNVPAALGTADIHDESLLPAVSAAWELIPNMKLRGSWSRTIARPTFLELAPVATEEFLLGDEFFGNPELGITRITNYDLRWEWFRRPGEVLALSGFRKTLEDPIEVINFSAGDRIFIQPLNFERGEVSGFEFEARTGLDFLWHGLRGLAVGVNYTKLDSHVDVPGTDPSEDPLPPGEPDFRASLRAYGLDEPQRPLQGQPDFIVNANLTYDNARSGTSFGIFYGAVGERLVTGAALGQTGGIPNVFEEPTRYWDGTIRQNVGPHVWLGAKLTNFRGETTRTVYRLPEEAAATEEIPREQIKTERLSGSRVAYTMGFTW